MIKKPLFSLAFVFASACGSPRPAHRAATPEYALLNPLLAAAEFDELRPFDHAVKAFAQERMTAGLATHISIYYRDLSNGPLFGLNADEKFSPASLLKVPLLMAALKDAEANPSLLKRRLRNDLPDSARSDFGGHGLKRGVEYTVDEALRAMIAASDNDAVIMLRTVIGDEPLNAVFREFGLVIPEFRSIDDSMTVREYATFFRVLYNASYLDKDMSQKALKYLTATEFKAGLVAGVPPGIAVAHKFGERSFEDRRTRQLHDCGIVYHPQRPYLLCVMTRGTDFGKLSSVIGDISARVYREVDSQPKR